jgi:hypothetical protein
MSVAAGKGARGDVAKHVRDLPAECDREDHREQDIERARNGSRNRNRSKHDPPLLALKLRRQLAAHQLGEEAFVRGAEVSEGNRRSLIEVADRQNISTRDADVYDAMLKYKPQGFERG